MHIKNIRLYRSIYTRGQCDMHDLQATTSTDRAHRLVLACSYELPIGERASHHSGCARTCFSDLHLHLVILLHNSCAEQVSYCPCLTFSVCAQSEREEWRGREQRLLLSAACSSCCQASCIRWLLCPSFVDATSNATLTAGTACLRGSANSSAWMTAAPRRWPPANVPRFARSPSAARRWPVRLQRHTSNTRHLARTIWRLSLFFS